MRFAVESWAPDYGTPLGPDEGELAGEPPETHHELPPDDWRPLTPGEDVAPAGRVRFVDGVRRIDAWVWVSDDDGVKPGIAASYAAGSVTCESADGVVVTRRPQGAWVEQALARRAVFSPARTLADVDTRHGRYQACQTDADSVEALHQSLQRQMSLLEQWVALQGDPVDLAVVDGPLSKLPQIGETVGYVKTRHRQYLPETLDRFTAALRPGERTPLFRTTGGWPRWSWYLRLPGGGGGHPLAGVVRCELAGDIPLARARELADVVAATLPRFASRPHRDPRAPQNLTPIGALERVLRHRLGDGRLMERALRAAAPA